MTIPPTSQLEDAAQKIVWNAAKKGTLKGTTPRLVRQMIEKQYNLESGTLDAPEYKSAIKAATAAAVAQGPPASKESESPKANTTPKRKRTSSSGVNGEDEEDGESLFTPKAKGKAKSKGKNEEEAGAAKKKRKTTKTKPVVSSDEDDKEPPPPPVPKSRPQLSSKFKSAEHVATSDMEEDEPGPIRTAGPSTSKLPSSSVKTKTSSSSTSKLVKSKEEPDDVKMDDANEKSESELSVLVDEPPKRKRKSKSGEKEPKKAAKSRSKKETPTLSKDEETIKRLKSLVVACGTRRVWSKVFEGLDTPQQQIRKLKEILSDLGMSGRMSMEQAKAIKEKREFEQELADVKEFADRMEGRPSRSRNVATKATVTEDSDKEDASEEDEDVDVAPRKRPLNARKSIIAFLGDQSDDE